MFEIFCIQLHSYATPCMYVYIRMLWLCVCVQFFQQKYFMHAGELIQWAANSGQCNAIPAKHQHPKEISLTGNSTIPSKNQPSPTNPTTNHPTTQATQANPPECHCDCTMHVDISPLIPIFILHLVELKWRICLVSRRTVELVKQRSECCENHKKSNSKSY